MQKTAALFIFLILVVSFFMRITTQTYPYGSDDSNRDYLVAHHIVQYQEYPMTGPFAAVTKSRNSPSYYYILAAFAYIKDDPIFLRVVSGILQVLTIYIIYKLARKLYDLPTAFLASMLISFNRYSLTQASYMWQPWVMQPIVNLSYLLLLISYQKKNYYILLLSVFCFVFAGSIHTSAFSISPILLVSGIAVLRIQKAKIKHYIGVVLTISGSFLAFYLPVFIAYSGNNSILPPLSSSNILGIYNPMQIGVNFLKNFNYFIGGSLFYITTIITTNAVLTLTICIMLIYYFYSKKQKEEKIFSSLILSSIILILLYISIVKTNLFNSYYGIHYFTPVYGLFIILFARTGIFIFRKNKYTKIVGILIFSAYFGFVLSGIYINSYHNKPNFTLKYLDDPAINAIRDDVLAIKKANNLPHFNFFKIEAPGGDKIGWKYKSTVFAVLERELDTRLVKIDDYNQEGFTQLAARNPKYIFLICPSPTTQLNGSWNCVANFLNSNENFLREKETYSNHLYSIHLIKRHE